MGFAKSSEQPVMLALLAVLAILAMQEVGAFPVPGESVTGMSEIANRWLSSLPCVSRLIVVRRASQKDRSHLSHDRRMRRPEPGVGLVPIVCATAKRKILSRGRAAVCKRSQMVILEEPTLGASTARADERALASIPRPDRTLDRRREVARAQRRRLGDAWPCRRGVFRPL